MAFQQLLKDKELRNKKLSVATRGVYTGGLSLILTLIVAISANSLSLWADWVATLVGFLTIFIAWLGFRKINTHPTVKFNYGFGRFESLSSIAMAILMVVSFICIASVTIMRILNPVPVVGSGLYMGIGLHVLFGYINGNLLLKTIRLEREEKSSLLTSQRRFYVIKFSTNILMLSSIFVSIILNGQKWATYFDLIVAIAIAIMILLNATRIIKYSIRDLLDHALEEQLQLLILRSLANHFDQYNNLHDIRTRLSGGKMYVELFLEFDGNLKHSEVLQTIGSMQNEIRETTNSDEVLIIPVSPFSDKVL